MVTTRREACASFACPLHSRAGFSTNDSLCERSHDGATATAALQPKGGAPLRRQSTTTPKTRKHSHPHGSWKAGRSVSGRTNLCFGYLSRSIRRLSCPPAASTSKLPTAPRLSPPALVAAADTAVYSGIAVPSPVSPLLCVEKRRKSTSGAAAAAAPPPTRPSTALRPHGPQAGSIGDGSSLYVRGEASNTPRGLGTFPWGQPGS